MIRNAWIGTILQEELHGLGMVALTSEEECRAAVRVKGIDVGVGCGVDARRT